MAKIQQNFNDLKDARKMKLDEIIDTIDVFNGAISLNDILNQDIPIIDALKNEKVSRLQERQKGK